MAVYLRVLARLALGGFFVASAGFKLAAPELFAELAVIANRRWGLWLVVALLALFIPVLGYGIAIGLDISCGCLGRADLSSLPQALLRDLLLLTLAGALLRHSRPVLTVPKEQ
ncbi:MauE/DoxX family redox-associated membrane protein [Aeromonas hydrophila]|uniref:MauE/DoxX family redox-associated membrane protein n=1 Tax=Aeromonas hydrophila TaxID=644 RepID=UPI002B48E535|nr:MauE/DoxX family redox-associated membrane protein [Aeromonas hydrophila]